MKLDKELYRKAYESYRQWNEAELVERARNAGQISTQKLWEQYVGLWEFCMQIAPSPSGRLRQKRLAEWNEYYHRVEKMETWRQVNGKAA